MNLFSTIVIENEEYIFLHDLEKAVSLQMDECLGMICTCYEVGLDTSSSDPYLDSIILAIGDSVAKTVSLVNESMVETAEQALVQRKIFQPFKTS